MDGECAGEIEERKKEEGREGRKEERKAGGKENQSPGQCPIFTNDSLSLCLPSNPSQTPEKKLNPVTLSWSSPHYVLQARC